MKFGISSYSYYRLIKKGNFTLQNAVAHAAKTGFDCIEFISEGISTQADPLAAAAEIKALCHSHNLPIVAYTVSGDLLTGCGGDMQAEVARIQRELDVAAALGAPLLRHDVTWGFPQDYPGVKTLGSILDQMAQGCRQITQYAKSLGIQTMTENHGQFMQDSERVLQVVSGVNDPNFGVLCDMGNFLCADEDPAKACGNVAAVAKHVHVKDMIVKNGSLPDPGRGYFQSRAGNYLRCTIAGHGDVPICQCLGIFKSRGYTGAISLEFEGIEDVLESIEISYENIRRYMA